MHRKVFTLPRHPKRGEQKIVIEKPLPGSVWMLVIDNDKYKPLVGLSDGAQTPKEVLDQIEKEYGTDVVGQFVYGGYSRCEECEALSDAVTKGKIK